MREDWLQRALRAIHRRQTGRLRGLPYPHSQAVRVAPPAPPFRKPSQTLPDVNPVPLRSKPHLWLVSRDGEDVEEPYDRIGVSDEVDIEQPAPQWEDDPAEALEIDEPSRFGLVYQARIVDFRARVERGEFDGAGGNTW